ncbi:spherulation-specific family 4 protein [Streptomyces sp. NPDC054887]
MKNLLVPFYEHPAERPDAWESLLRAASRLYGVVLNPADGPGEAPDPAFAAVSARLRAAGVRVLGYTDTDYARRPHTAVVRDLLRHRDWYGADGAFLDQAASGPEALPHYRGLAAAARAAGSATVVLNHGVRPDPGYRRLADLLVTFEGTWETYRESPEARSPAAAPRSRERVCHLVYAAPPAAAFTAAVGCVVPGGAPHPWGTLPHALEAP